MLARRLASFTLICALVCPLGCGGGAGGETGQGEAKTGVPPKQADTAPSDPADPDAGETEGSGNTAPEGLDDAMKEHFIQAVQIKQAVIDGDLEAVAEPARWLAEELDPETLPKPWKPYLDAMQASAKKAADAQDLPTAALAAGELVGACADCHATTGKGPKFDEPGKVPEGEDTTARMLRHQWAADRMWEGIVSNSETHWKLGTHAISEKPPKPCPIPSDDILPKEVLDLREKIYDLGPKAAEATDRSTRTKLYGEYLQTCAGCHVGGC